MIKTGIVTEIHKKYTCILTSSGEFAKIKYTGQPSLGEIRSGSQYKPTYKIPAAAAIAFLTFMTGGVSYFIPAYAVTVKTNPEIKLSVNIWDKIIKSEPLNEDAKNILSNVALKNVPIESGLKSIVEELKKENFIDEDNSTSNNNIEINIDGKSGKSLNIDEFLTNAKNNKIDIEITNNGVVTTSIKNENTENSNTNSKSDKNNIEEFDKNEQNNNSEQNNKNTNTNTNTNKNNDNHDGKNVPKEKTKDTEDSKKNTNDTSKETEKSKKKTKDKNLDKKSSDTENSNKNK